MAQIELRNATIRLIDGYSNTALVNDSPMTGDTTVDIDTLGTADIFDIGTRFTVAGSSETYYVTDEDSDERQLVTVDATSGNFTLGFEGTVAAPISTQTTANIAEGATAAAVQSALELLAAIAPGDILVTGGTGGPWTVRFIGTYAKTNIKPLVGVNVSLMGGGASIAVTTPIAGGATSSLTFTPSFLTADGVPINNAAIAFAGRTLEIKVGDGNLDYTENRNMDYRLDRGEIDTVREGDDVPMDLKLDFVWEFLTAASDDSTPTIEDVFKHRGLAAGWTSSATNDTCAPFALDIEIEHVPPCEDVESEIITLPDFRWESFEHSAKDAQVSVSGKCNAKLATVVRV